MLSLRCQLGRILEQGLPLVTVVLGMAGWAGSCCCPEYPCMLPIWPFDWELFPDPPPSPLSYKRVSAFRL